jgi:hypothetical protein
MAALCRRAAALLVFGALPSSVRAARSRPTHYENTFQPGDELELWVYLSPYLRFSDFNNSEALLWHATGLSYDLSSTGEITTTVQVNVTAHMLGNGSMFCHSYFTKAGYSPDPRALASYDKWSSTHTVMSMIAYGERLKPMGLYNLLTGEPAPWETALRVGAEEAAVAGRPEGEYLPYWKPKMHLQLVVDTQPYEINMMPVLMHNTLHQTGLMQGHRYRPFVYVNELTVMKAHWMGINTSVTTLPLELSAKPLRAEHFQWMVNLKQSFAMQEETLGITEKESEELRGMFVHTNPVLLYTTVAVSAFHLLFDCLAFKNDLSFWSSVDTMEGLSTRTVLLNQLMEGVILLYLVNEDASWLVKISSLFTLVLGFFKIFKSLRVKRKDEEKSEDGVSLTDQIDRLAFRYLSPPLLLLVVGYAGWCLVYCYFRGWYSWILECLVALVYGGGFIVMTPQLFINYRLKSVACLPWKFFMYKALNTFIDDLFAFIIKMPTLHRMSCFRDDIVFLIFLYQRWIYKVDNSRVNEYGQRGDDGEPAPQTAPNGKTKKPKGGAAREAEGTQDKDRELSAAELKAVKRKGKEAAKGGAGEDTATQGGAGGRKKEPKKTK